MLIRLFFVGEYNGSFEQRVHRKEAKLSTKPHFKAKHTVVPHLSLTALHLNEKF